MNPRMQAAGKDRTGRPAGCRRKAGGRPRNTHLPAVLGRMDEGLACRKVKDTNL